ncbi:uncharacterized protein B0P05DRAFT_229699 [Gilbertella persicaria]|uniref:uncharacterized protein n=1 Tax=Gilbertella persicaria TaxID=101096 RepID=UPI0022203C9D|nr:uncharacterized protein B0P05DRAFT_229699 [Gilbertella persicaria]KAI8064819.1 hypothetical protein B0P05DRAFT_229699 [Gilbertella persicaria]
MAIVISASSASYFFSGSTEVFGMSLIAFVLSSSLYADTWDDTIIDSSTIHISVVKTIETVKIFVYLDSKIRCFYYVC